MASLSNPELRLATDMLQVVSLDNLCDGSTMLVQTELEVGMELL